MSLLSNWPIKDFIINTHGICTWTFHALQSSWFLLVFAKIFFPIIHSMFLYLSIILESQCQRGNDLHCHVRWKKEVMEELTFPNYLYLISVLPTHTIVELQSGMGRILSGCFQWLLTHKLPTQTLFHDIILLLTTFWISLFF